MSAKRGGAPDLMPPERTDLLESAESSGGRQAAVRGGPILCGCAAGGGTNVDDSTGSTDRLTSPARHRSERAASAASRVEPSTAVRPTGAVLVGTWHRRSRSKGCVLQGPFSPIMSVVMLMAPPQFRVSFLPPARAAVRTNPSGLAFTSLFHFCQNKGIVDGAAPKKHNNQPNTARNALTDDDDPGGAGRRIPTETRRQDLPQGPT